MESEEGRGKGWRGGEVVESEGGGRAGSDEGREGITLLNNFFCLKVSCRLVRTETG